MNTRREPLRLADVGAEAALIAGGGRAVLLQLANPAIGHAVARHSDFRSDPIRRLRNTLVYVYALVYGTPEQVTAVRAMVDRAHARVRSDPGSLPHYDATDARLQLWVAATLYDTAVDLRRRLIGPLSADDLDAIYQDYEIVGRALQVPAGLWPRDREEFASYWREQSLLLSVDGTVQTVAHDLLHPSTGPIWLRAGMPLARLVTAGLLSPELREAFQLPWDADRQRRFNRAMRALRAVNGILPRAVREWPRNRLLRRVL
ncbi:MAG: hypothetical protein JWL94_325 [Microbacteriaceae bacterium]|jgi:uncharacterized protein (DUF2236 family)|nr:hypothetical protein [Microbacteriaceae bacterium]HEV7956747.1 oxygenase MpaB family protein [Marisediminicola sp.]